jgi:tetratricopeptide (TPR) repeat protein
MQIDSLTALWVDPCAKRLAERLAGLPLALATAGTYLQRSIFTFERYLQEYEKRWNIDSRRPTRLQEYEELTLYTTWDLSYVRLEKDDPDAAKLLGLLAYFGNKTLWYGLLHTDPTGVSSTPDWMHEIIENDITFDGVMRTLTEYYFLEVHPLLQSWSMHNCVHDWTLATLNKDINAQSYWYAFDCVDRSMNQVGEDFLGNVSYSRLAVHASRLVHPRFLQSDLLSAMSPSRLEVAQRLAQLLKDQIQLAAAEQMYVRVLAGCEQTLGSDHASTLRVMNDFGNLYMDQGRLGDSETMQLRALARKEKTLGKKHPSTLDTAHNLGDVYREQDRLDDAEKMYNLALAGSEEALGADHPSTLLTVHNIGILYRSQGKLDDAERMYMRVLIGAEKAGEADHVSALLTVNNLGNVYSDQGKLEEAEKMYMRALRGYEKALGANHTSTLLVVHNMGDLYCAQGKLDYAVQMYRRAVEGRERALGNNHASTLLSVKHLGEVYRKQGCLVEAEQMFTRAALREERVSQAQGQGGRI